MQIFETIACSLCKSKDYTKIYKSNQYSNSKLGTRYPLLCVINVILFFKIHKLQLVP